MQKLFSFGLLGLFFFASSLAGAQEKALEKKPMEGPVKAFLGDSKFAMQQVFQDERFPNIVVTIDGTLIATWGSNVVRARRSEDGGVTWGEEITIAESGIQGGGTTVDETTGDILAFVEDLSLIHI